MRIDGGPAELCPGLAAGTLWNLDALLAWKPDAIAVLDRMPDRVWESGFEGELLYYPIEPWGVLPAGLLERLAGEIASRVADGGRVAVFSREDCGRVGYVAACALFRLGVPDPVARLRANWDSGALREGVQRSEVTFFCGRHAAPAAPRGAQKTAHIRIDDVEAFQSDADIRREYSRISRALGGEARFILRFSGLLPSVKIMAEAADPALCQRAIDEFIDVVTRTGHYEGDLDEW